MSDNNTTQDVTRNPNLQPLQKLIGQWKVSGGVQGTITYQWIEGGFFLSQQVELEHNGQQIKGMEIIGHEHRFGEEPSTEIRSRFYSFNDGMTLDYVYEMEDNTLIIWGGEKGSPAYFKGRFSADGQTLSGGWVFPGGGYEMNANRAE